MVKYVDEGLLVFRTRAGETLENAHLSFSPSIGQESNTVEVIGLELMDWNIPRWCFPSVPFSMEEGPQAESVDVCLLLGLSGNPTFDEVELVCPLPRGCIFPSRDKLVSRLMQILQEALGDDLRAILDVTVSLTDREELEIVVKCLDTESNATRLSFARLYVLPHTTSTLASDEECVIRRLMGFRDPASLVANANTASIGSDGKPADVELRLVGSVSVDVTPITFMDIYLPSNKWRTAENNYGGGSTVSYKSNFNSMPFERISLREPLVNFGKLGAIELDVTPTPDLLAVYEQEIHSVSALSKRADDRFSPSAVHHRVRLFENPLPMKVFSSNFRTIIRIELDGHHAFGNPFDVLRTQDGTAFPLQLVFRVVFKGPTAKHFRKLFIETAHSTSMQSDKNCAFGYLNSVFLARDERMHGSSDVTDGGAIAMEEVMPELDTETKVELTLRPVPVSPDSLDVAMDTDDGTAIAMDLHLDEVDEAMFAQDLEQEQGDDMNTGPIEPIEPIEPADITELEPMDDDEERHLEMDLDFGLQRGEDIEPTYLPILSPIREEKEKEKVEEKEKTEVKEPEPIVEPTVQPIVEPTVQPRRSSRRRYNLREKPVDYSKFFF